MPTGKVVFASSQAAGLEELAGAQQKLLNFVIGAAGDMTLRPGLRAYQTASETGNIIGICTDPIRRAVLYVTDDRYLWGMTSPDTRFALSDSTSTTQLDGTARPTFAVTNIGVMVAGGGAVQKVTSLSATSTRLGGSPPVASHICALRRRLVVNKLDYGSGNFFWSGNQFGAVGSGLYETWNAINFDEADSRPDPIVALYENSEELFAFGRSTLQIFGRGSNPLRPFAPSSPGNTGCSAPYSPVRVDEDFAWIDDKRRVVMGRAEVQALSVPWVQSQVEGMTSMNDVWGFRCQMGQWDFLVWVFPTDGTALCFERNNKVWSEWRGYSDGDYAALTFGAYVQAFDTGLHLVGTTDGHGVCELTTAVGKDISQNIVAEWQGGFRDFGLRSKKRGIRTVYTTRRGSSAFGSTLAAGTLATVEVRHRDDLGAWAPWEQLSLGAAPDYDPVITHYDGGVFRQRENAIRYSSGGHFDLADVSQDFEECDS